MSDEQDEIEPVGLLVEDVSNVVEMWFKGMRKIWESEKRFMDSVTQPRGEE